MAVPPTVRPLGLARAAFMRQEKPHMRLKDAVQVQPMTLAAVGRQQRKLGIQFADQQPHIGVGRGDAGNGDHVRISATI